MLKLSKMIKINKIKIFILSLALLLNFAAHAEFNIKARSAILQDYYSGEVLYEKNADASIYPASLTKIMTSIIAFELLEKGDLNLDDKFIVSENFVFVAKRAKTYDEEKQVADKAPVDNIIINDIEVKKEKIIINDFSYIIKIADFYYNKTALLMLNRIKNKTKIKNPKILKLSSKEYRVYLGPFNNINSLEKYFNDISILEFENIEIIRND